MSTPELSTPDQLATEPTGLAPVAGHPRPIRSVLVANRGEIACRVIASLKRLGLRSIAVYSDADAQARHVAEADVAVRLGPAPATQSYLDIDAVVDAARRTGADAVHPGYGFLSENQQFASALDDAGIIFIGPPASAIATMGDKITARAAVTQRDVPVVPGISRPGLTDADLIAAAPDIGFPVLIKPSAGGGGKGMHRVDDPAGLPDALARARREAASAFGDDTLFIEHFVDTPRHIEVQVLADTHGAVIHLGERECSLQRRHQKVIEEAPSALLDPETRARIGQAACDAARSVGYTGAGTVEFIVSAHRPDAFFFMEMNTRLQVEHPVTEMVTGVDLVEQQIRVARGEPLGIAQEDVTLTGHAVEARVYAEDPAAGFLPTGGTVVGLAEPDTSPGSGVRLDSALIPGLDVGSDYDPMLAKVIAHGTDRDDALDRLDRALAATRVLGVVTNIDFCRFVLAQPDVVAGRLDTSLLDRLVTEYAAPQPDPAALALVAMARIGFRDPGDPWTGTVGYRLGANAPVITRLTAGGDPIAPRRATVSAWVRDADLDSLSARVEVVYDAPADDAAGGAATDSGARGGEVGDKGAGDKRASAPESWCADVVYRTPDRLDGDTAVGSVRFTVDGVGQDWLIADRSSDSTDGHWWIGGPAGTWIVEPARTLHDEVSDERAGDIVSPMPGTVVAVAAQDGTAVAAGDSVVVVEAMKMEHTLTAPVDGVATITARVGDKVAAGESLAHVHAPTADAPTTDAAATDATDPVVAGSAPTDSA
ncbi:acetyl/propionyl/methylcrotonyl-CoA carboxylase subunit alpha [Gordonia sinesedis]